MVGRRTVRLSTAIVMVAISITGLGAVGVANASHTDRSHSMYVWDVVVDPARPSTVYAVTDDGVYKSTDSGGSWLRKVVGLTTLATKTLEIASDGTLYLGASQSIFRSVNGGDSWTRLSSACSAVTGCPDTWALASAPKNPTVVYAGTREGVLRTVDGGRTWQSTVGVPRQLVLSIAVHPGRPNTVFASGPFGVFKSTDAGETWISSSVGITLKPGHSVKVVVIHPRDPNVLIAGLTEGGLFRSTDGGVTWSLLDHPCDRTVWYCDNHIEAIEYDPINPETLWVGTLYGSVFKTVNGGSTWSLSSAGISGGWVKSLDSDPARPTTVYAGTYGGGVFKSTDAGASWKAANRGL